MTRYRVPLNTHLSVMIEVEASSEDEAAESAWQIAEDYAQTLRPGGDQRLVSVEASFDGIGADEIEEVTP